MALLKSLPDEWQCNGIQGLADMSEKDGYEAVSNGLKELEAEGYLARLKRHGLGGKWDWLWIHSDDPSDIAHAIEEWGQGVRRGGNTQAQGRPDQRPVGVGAGTVSGKPEHGSMTGKPVDGSPVDGSAVDGKPGDKEVVREEIYSREEAGGGLGNAREGAETAPEPPPPDPPEATGYDPANPRCREHRSVTAGERGPNCAACARAREWQEAKDAADVAAAALALRACPMCDADGLRVDDRRVPLSPYRTCDHVTPSEAVFAEIRSAEAAANNTARPAAHEEHCTKYGKGSALAAIRSVLSNRAITKTDTDSDFPATGDPGHTTGVHAASG